VFSCLANCNRFSNAIQAKLEAARVARLATLDAEYGPHIVPVCFVYDGKVFYSAVDRKPKRVAPERLARLRHITTSADKRIKCCSVMSSVVT
jgi:nitroimidazol reductase NimA-like FMN-containing flavoprotein (pyridoxamine 5'-phosphate oxidase superfamily)